MRGTAIAVIASAFVLHPAAMFLFDVVSPFDPATNGVVRMIANMAIIAAIAILLALPFREPKAGRVISKVSM